jgi:uncharacterized membrane protein YeaQ/YmgE (transglycosylase-associated protein family)
MAIIQMQVIAWFIVGGIAGWLTSVAFQTQHQAKLFLNMTVGAFSALLVGIVFRQFETVIGTQFNGWSFLVTFVGAVVVVVGVHWLTPQRHSFN